MNSITVRTWNDKDSLTMGTDAFTINYLGEEKVIPFSQVISLSVKDPKSKLRPGMITITVGGAPNSMVHLTRSISIGNKNGVDFPHGFKYLAEGREIQQRFIDYQSKISSASVIPTATSADEIRQFKALLDDGIITQEEFETKKRQLLGL